MNTWINVKHKRVCKFRPYNGWFYLDGTYIYILFHDGKQIAKMKNKLYKHESKR